MNRQDVRRETRQAEAFALGRKYEDDPAPITDMFHSWRHHTDSARWIIVRYDVTRRIESVGGLS